MDIRLKHGYVTSLGNVTDFDSFFDQCLFKRERAANQEADIAFFPIRRYVSQFFCKYAVFVDTVSWNISADITAFAHGVCVGRSFDDFKNRTRKWILFCKFFEICCVFRRQDYKVCLCVTTAHSCGREVNNSISAECPNLRWCFVYIRCDVKCHDDSLLSVLQNYYIRFSILILFHYIFYCNKIKTWEQ